MMGHWDENEHWIKGQGPNFILKEIWDGARFNEISWFWDPDSQWMLPIKCQLCGNILSIDEIKAFPKEEERCVITCPECGTRWKQGPSYARGDPRNIALIGHWDGWQPFGYPGTHSCGLEVNYVRSFPCLPSGTSIIGALILLWTGDYPAQHEVGKFIKHWLLPCRRDKLKGTINPEGGSTYYYVNNRYHARYPWEKRKLDEDLETMKDIGEEDRKTVWANKSKNSGYTGLSILYRLHKLYGFDIFRDLVYDTMHNLPTNVISAQLKSFISSEKIDSKLVDQRLDSFPWTAELKDGRVPKGFGSRLAFWKAEELHKFAFPASEVIFADLLDDTDFHIWQLSVRMTELVFSKRDGWSHDDVNLFGKLAQRYLVITEEHRGLTSCTVTEHNILHIASDAMRFSHPDNYWCFSFERAVRRYVTTKSNFKNI
ncbi:uncharacterized protein LOC122962134 [Acropora millepora]|uniref:uncharacterized protein LOC122962134 n=1 Tax=Acropora millepora TaxID=45264 RepID=UPI001CF45568|nr:uncharacterized protein LOC122962134 [Acropora millepora]